MAYDPLALADLVADKLDLAPIDVTDLVQAVPFLNLLPTVASSNGETHKYNKETQAPVVGFRAANVGRDEDSSVDTIVTETLKILDFSWSVDKAVADVWMGGREALIAREGLRHVKAALVKAEIQLFYGTTSPGDSGGFSGMINRTNVDAIADAMTIDATGSTASTASSCWAVRVGPNDLSMIVRGDNPISVGETSDQRIISSGSLTYPAYYTPGCLWLGLQAGSIYSMGRIINITEDSGKGLTDILIGNLLAEFPVGRFPTHLVMNRRSLRQLRAARTATNSTGAPAPFPTEAHGVPIVVVESITSTEELVA